MARGAASASVAPARSVSSRSAKTKANASLADDDKDLDRLIAKHDERGARGWAKKSKAGEAAGSSSSSKLEVAPTMPEEKQVSKPKGKAKGKGKKKDVTEPDAVVEEVHEDEVVEARINSVAPLQASKRHINSGEGSSVDAIASPKKDSSDKMHSTPKKKDKSSSSPKKKEKTSSSPKKASSPAKYFSSPSKPRQRGMPEEQIRSFLDNYDLEVENRLRTALRLLDSSVNSSRTQMMTIKIGKLPRAVRLLSMHDFVNQFQGSVQAVQSKAAFLASRARKAQEEHEEVEELQRKRKEASEEPATSKTRQKMTASAKAKTGPRPKAKGKQKQLINEIAAGSMSPSKVRPPSAATFAPRLEPSVIAGRSSGIPKLPPTPMGARPRAARAGEQVQWMSLNGSPITGVIGPDGVVHTLTSRTSSKAQPAVASPSRNWVSLEDEASDTSAHLLELAKGIDRGSRRVSGRDSSGGPSKAIRAIPPTSSSSFSSNDNHDEDHHRVEQALGDFGDDDDDFSSLPDEEAYTARIMQEEEERRSRMASSSDGIRAARSSSLSVSTAGLFLSSSSPIRKGPASGRLASTSASTRQQQQRVSLLTGDGERHSLSKLRVEDLLAMPAAERDAMIRVLEDLKARQEQH